MTEEESVERVRLRNRADIMLLLAICGGLSTLTLTSAVVPVIHYIWLALGNSLHHLVTSNNNGQPGMSGGTTNAKSGLNSAAGPAGNSPIAIVMVDSEEHYFDDTILPGLRYKVCNCQELAVPQKIATAK